MKTVQMRLFIMLICSYVDVLWASCAAVWTPERKRADQEIRAAILSSQEAEVHTLTMGSINVGLKLLWNVAFTECRSHGNESNEQHDPWNMESNLITYGGFKNKHQSWTDVTKCSDSENSFYIQLLHLVDFNQLHEHCYCRHSLFLISLFDVVKNVFHDIF